MPLFPLQYPMRNCLPITVSCCKLISTHETNTIFTHHKMFSNFMDILKLHIDNLFCYFSVNRDIVRVIQFTPRVRNSNIFCVPDAYNNRNACIDIESSVIVNN